MLLEVNIMKLKEIRLEKIKVYKENSEIYEGLVDNAPQELLDTNVVSLKFKDSILYVEI